MAYSWASIIWTPGVPTSSGWLKYLDTRMTLNEPRPSIIQACKISKRCPESSYKCTSLGHNASVDRTKVASYTVLLNQQRKKLLTTGTLNARYVFCYNLVEFFTRIIKNSDDRGLDNRGSTVLNCLQTNWLGDFPLSLTIWIYGTGIDPCLPFSCCANHHSS